MKAKILNYIVKDLMQRECIITMASSHSISLVMMSYKFGNAHVMPKVFLLKKFAQSLKRPLTSRRLNAVICSRMVVILLDMAHVAGWCIISSLGEKATDRCFIVVCD